MVEEILDEKCPRCGGVLKSTPRTIQKQKGAIDEPPYVEYWYIIECKECDYERKELMHSEQY